MSILHKIINAVGPLVPQSIVERGAREWLNRKHGAIGTVTALQIDSASHRITLDLELKGDSQPLHVVISRYELTNSEGKSLLEIKELNTSREWINVLAQAFLKGKKFEVPRFAGAVL